MKMNVITLNEEDIKEAIKILDETGSVCLGGNYFTLGKIQTILELQTEKYFDDDLVPVQERYFIFSYNDQSIKANFKVCVPMKADSCIAFIKQQQLLNDAQLNAILDKASYHMKTMTEDGDFDDNVNILNSVAYNEALMLLTKGINKSDADEVKSEFDSKYNAYKATINDAAANLLEGLHYKLIKAKLSNRR